MATVSNVKLDIQKGGKDTLRTVRVTYDVCFNECELMDGTVFVENVSLRGDDPIWDDHLLTLRNHCVKATERCVHRGIATRVSRSRLDEDGDTVIFGIPLIANRDEIYAQVRLTPFHAVGTDARSNLVTGQFGAAGND